MKQRTYTTISVKPEVSAELGRLRKRYKTSKAEIIKILILRNRELTNLNSKEKFIKLMQKETPNQREFFNRVNVIVKNQHLLNQSINELKRLFPSTLSKFVKNQKV